MRSRLFSSFLVVLLPAFADLAMAGSFSISPTRLELAPGQRAAVVTIRNADSVPLTVQTQLVSWSQAEGEDVYVDTREILATPPVFTIPPNGEQVVRVALRTPPGATNEQAYRVFFQEVPQEAKADVNTLNIALRVGIPLFVVSKEKAAGKLEWKLLSREDGKLQVEASNIGNAHVQVTGFELSLTGTSERLPVEGMRYVLPGSRVSWTVDPPANLASAPASAWVIGTSDQGAFDAQAAIAPQL